MKKKKIRTDICLIYFPKICGKWLVIYSFINSSPHKGVLWDATFVFFFLLWHFNPRPPEVFLVPPKGGELLKPLPGFFFYTEHQYLLHVYRYGPLVSIDTKMSTIKLHKTSL